MWVHLLLIILSRLVENTDNREANKENIVEDGATVIFFKKFIAGAGLRAQLPQEEVATDKILHRQACTVIVLVQPAGSHVQAQHNM